MHTKRISNAIVTLCWGSLSVFANLITRGESQSHCGGTLTAIRGVLQTPGFPNEFRVPIFCKWVIDATEIRSANTSIVVYLTQLFLIEGLSFEEYETYDQSYNILGKKIHAVLENNVSKTKWVRTSQNVLVVTFQLESIENAHLRILDYFLDVYGFNITYEITTDPIRRDACIMSDCGFTGICYDDFTYAFAEFGSQKLLFVCFVGDFIATVFRAIQVWRVQVDQILYVIQITWSTAKIMGFASKYCRLQRMRFVIIFLRIGRQVGTTSVNCECPQGFTGDRCQKKVRYSSKYGELNSF